MSNRMTWPQICRSEEFKGLWVALDNCRYDQASLQPIEGDVVDSDEDLAELCSRMRAVERTSCAILFCDGEVLVQRPASTASSSERPARPA